MKRPRPTSRRTDPWTTCIPAGSTPPWAEPAVVAFANERYKIEVSPKSENLNLSVSGEGVSIADEGSDRFQKMVSVDETMETFVVISLTAHPDSETYTLTVTKMEDAR